jgi:hypothetical protein
MSSSANALRLFGVPRDSVEVSVPEQPKPEPEPEPEKTKRSSFMDGHTYAAGVKCLDLQDVRVCVTLAGLISLSIVAWRVWVVYIP